MAGRDGATLTDAGAGTALASVNQMTGPIELTVAELAGYLYPRMSVDQLDGIVVRLPKLVAVGKRATGGRPLPTYDAAEIMDLHAPLTATA